MPESSLSYLRTLCISTGSLEEVTGQKKGLWSASFSFKLPKKGEPGGLDDPRRKGLNGAATRRYLNLLNDGVEPDEAIHRVLIEKRDPSTSQKKSDEALTEASQPKTPYTESLPAMAFQKLFGIENTTVKIGKIKWSDSFTFELPKRGEPGGLDDPRRKGMNGTVAKRYLNLLHDGVEPDEAREMALGRRKAPSTSQKRREEATVETSQPKRQRTESIDAMAYQERCNIENTTDKREQMSFSIEARLMALAEGREPSTGQKRSEEARAGTSQPKRQRTESTDDMAYEERFSIEKATNNMERSKWSDRPSFELPNRGEPRGLDDSRRKDMNGSVAIKYLNLVHNRVEPDEARRMAHAGRREPLNSQERQDEERVGTSQPKRQHRESMSAMEFQGRSDAEETKAEKSKGLASFSFKLPKFGEPGGLDDPLRKGLNWSATKRYLYLLHDGVEPGEARRMALGERNELPTSQERADDPRAGTSQPERQRTESMHTMPFQGRSVTIYEDPSSRRSGSNAERSGSRNTIVATSSGSGTRDTKTTISTESGTRHTMVGSPRRSGSEHIKAASPTRSGSRQTIASASRSGTKDSATGSGTRHTRVRSPRRSGSEHIKAASPTRSGSRQTIASASRSGTKDSATGSGTRHTRVGSPRRSSSKHTTTASPTRSYSRQTIAIASRSGTRHTRVGSPRRSSSKHTKAASPTRSGSRHSMASRATEIVTRHIKAASPTRSGSRHSMASRPTESVTRHTKAASPTRSGSRHSMASRPTESVTRHSMDASPSKSGTRHTMAASSTGSGTRHTVPVSQTRSGTRHTTVASLTGSRHTMPPKQDRSGATQPKSGKVVTVLAKDHPLHILSRDELNAVEEALIEEMLFANQDTSLKFCGITFQAGKLLLNCKNDSTVEWVKRVAPKLNNWKGPELMATEEEFSRDNLVQVFLPSSSGRDSSSLLQLLAAQNRDIKVDYWKILRTEKEGSGTFVIIGIDDRSMDAIDARGGVLSYRFGTISVGRLKQRGRAHGEKIPSPVRERFEEDMDIVEEREMSSFYEGEEDLSGVAFS